jgi:cation transport regulator ChaC
MAQKFPQIGLRAVFEIGGAMPNVRRWLRATRDIDRASQQTARSVTRAGSDMARSWDQFINRSKELEAVLGAPVDTSSYTEIKDAFFDLGRNARVNIALFDELTERGVGYADAMQVAGGATKFNIELFDRLTRQGVEVGEAFRRATNFITLFGRSFSGASVAIAGTTAVLRIGLKIIRDSVTEYEELAEATRRVRLQTGLLTREASSWVNVAEAAGVSVGTSERAMTQFLSKVADVRKEQIAGTLSTSDFAKALNVLEVSITDGEDNLKSTEQLLREINEAFRRLGPGAQTADTAVALFGRTGRQLLPILVDQEQSLTDMEERFIELGAVITKLDEDNYEKLRKANIELEAAVKGVRLEIGREYIPIIAKWKSELADLLNVLRKASAIIRTSQDLYDAVTQGQIKLSEAQDFYTERLRFRLGLESEAARTVEELAQAQSNAAQEIAVSEAEIRAEREKTLRQLDDIKSTLDQKLADIDRDADRRWEGILVGRVREHFDRLRQETRRMDDIRQALNNRLDAIEADFAKRWDDILVKRQRDALLRGIRLAQRFEAIARAAEQSRLNTRRDFADREAKLRQATQRRIEDIERDARRRREELERDHQRRLVSIRLEFIDTATEAARRNDAVAVAQAQRQRARDLRDEQRKFADEQQDLQRSLAEKRQDIELDRQEREEDHRQELAKALQRIEENNRLQKAELVRQNAEERVLRNIRFQWELEDFNAAKAEQKEAARLARDDQLKELRKANEIAAEERAIDYKRQRVDFDTQRQQQIDDALFWYQQERDELAIHLNLTGAQLEAAYAVWAQAAAAAAAEVAQAAATAVSNEILQYQRLLTEAQRGRAGLQPRTLAPLGPANRQRLDERGIWVPSLPVLGMQAGGVVQASSPTHIVMGEGGPETGVFLPGRSSSLNVNHNFGRIGVDVQGLPGGMNAQQIEGLFYAFMTQLAKGIQVPRN